MTNEAKAAIPPKDFLESNPSPQDSLPPRDGSGMVEEGRHTPTPWVEVGGGRIDGADDTGKLARINPPAPLSLGTRW